MSNFSPQTMELVRAVRQEAERLLQQRRGDAEGPRPDRDEGDERPPVPEARVPSQHEAPAIRERVTEADTSLALGHDQYSTAEIQNLLANGGTVHSNDGEKIGKLGQVYLDDRTGAPEWVTVKTGMFGGAESFVPLRQAQVKDNEIRVPYGTDKVKDAPRMEDAEGHLSEGKEADLYRYYDLDYSAAAANGGAPRPREVLLHEVRPIVDEETVPVDRVRMNTETVTENQQVNEAPVRGRRDEDLDIPDFLR